MMVLLLPWDDSLEENTTLPKTIESQKFKGITAPEKHHSFSPYHHHRRRPRMAGGPFSIY
jgi:hypothetical protein